MRIRSSRVSAHRTPAWLQATLALTSVLAATNCSAPPGAIPVDDDDSDIPEYSGSFGAPGTSTPVQPGANTPSNGATGSTNTNGSAPAPTNNGSEQNGASNAPLNPSTNTNTGSNSGASNNGSTPANNGAAGSSMVPPPSGNQGAGGSSMGGTGNTPAEPPPNQNPPVTQPPVTQPPVTQPPVTPTVPDIACPAGATFCSGFEGEALPDIAGFQANPVAPIEFDTVVRHSGNQSFMVRAAASQGFNVREVVVPIPGQQFWVRLFVQTSTEFGDNTHDSLFVASTATEDQDNNDEHGPEFSEQGNQVLLNADDNPLAGANGPGFPQVAGPRLAPNTWHCLEAFYDGGSGDVEIFSDGQSLIDAPAFKPVTFETFRFGYIQFNNPRTIWFDDVVVAPDRVGCN